MEPMTDSTCAYFGEYVDRSMSYFDPWVLGFDHQAVLDGDAQMALYPSLDEYFLPNSCPGQQKEATPRDPCEPSLFDDNVYRNHEDYEKYFWERGIRDGSRKGFVLRELLEEYATKCPNFEQLLTLEAHACTLGTPLVTGAIKSGL
jgi:hypothetical protein